MSFNLDEYVDVAERIREFYERFPEGSLKTGSPPQFVQVGGGAFVVYHAQAWRTYDDQCPADGWAWEPVPGPTQFTKDSELQNAETAAWGRAIVACGFETKKIASAEEVRNRSGVGAPTGRADGEPAGSSSDPVPTPELSGAAPGAASEPPLAAPENPAEKARQAAEAAKAARTPTDDGQPENVIVTFGKHKDKPLGEIPRGYLEWIVEKYEPKTAEQRRIVAAAAALTGVEPAPAEDPYADVPF